MTKGMKAVKDLIKKHIQPSKEQMGPVLFRELDVIVDAGAGTGKTRTLVARYISLLAEGYDLRSIAAITFTKKAAREMRSRIRSILGQIVKHQTEQGTQTGRWQKLYSALDAARIGTIHSLAAEIIRNHPAEIGIDPRFELLDETEAVLLQSEAVQAGLAWAADSKTAADLLIELGDWQLTRILTNLLKSRLEIEPYLERTPDQIWSIWKAELISPVKNFLQDPEVKTRFQDLEVLCAAGIKDQAAEKGDAFVPFLDSLIDSWQSVQKAVLKKDWDSIIDSMNRIADSLKQKGSKANWGTVDPKEIVADLQSLVKSHLGDLEGITISFELERKVAENLIPALLEVYQKAENYYQEQKEERRSLDFDDLEVMALGLLEENHEVRHFWIERIQAVLVDEFQDTNDRQRRLVKILGGDRGRLFIVGDGKQSIYRFRGADVAVFREERDQFSREGQYFQLAKTYRTHADLTGDYNHLLRNVLGDESDQPYIEPFSALEPFRSEPEYGLQKPFIEFHLSIGSKSSGALEVAARTAGQRIIEIVHNSRDQEPKLTFGDVAVLCRASSSFPAYEDAFEKLQIPFTTISGKGFYQRPEIRDVLNSLRAVANPEDDLALAGFLRSPVIGFSDDGLLTLRNYQKAEDFSSLLEALQTVPSEVLGQESQQRDLILTFLEEIGSMVGRMTAADVMARYLDRTLYMAVLKQAGQDRAAENLKKLLESAHFSGLISLDTYLEHIDEIQNSSAREGEAQILTSGSVQIMSVHQAKGLEFPVVVIGDASKPTRSARGVLVQEPFGVVMPYSEDKLIINQDGGLSRHKYSSAVYQLAAAEEKRRDLAESKRLLYVAATRARDKLLISGIISGIRKNGKLYSLQGWLGELGDPVGLGDIEVPYDPDGSTSHEFILKDDNLALNAYIYEPGIDFSSRTPHREEPPQDADDFNFDLVDALQGEESDPGPEKEINLLPFSARQAPSWLVGQLVHRSLELWRFPGEVGESGYADWSGRWLRARGVMDEAAIRKAVGRAGELLLRFQRHQLFRDMNQAEKRLSELTLNWSDGDVFHHGVIDSLYLRDGEWQLVEFKTDRAANRAEMVRIIQMEKYWSQVSGYQEALKGVLGLDVNPRICFLDVGNGIEIYTLLPEGDSV